MAGDRRPRAGYYRLPQHGEGLSGRSVLRRGHRGRPACGRDGEALPDPARALREGRRALVSPRRKGQPACPDDQGQHADGHAGPRGRSALRRLGHRSRHRRIFTYDVTGGRYEETDFHHRLREAGMRRQTIKLGFRDDLSRDEAVELAVDGAVPSSRRRRRDGRSRPLRGIYPIIATVTRAAFTRDRRRGGGALCRGARSWRGDTRSYRS